MPISDEFKQKLKAGQIVDALTLAIGEIIELEITTWVSTNDTPVEGDELKPQPDACMRTRINLVEGDIENQIGEKFLGSGPYSELKDFHLEQVKEGRLIIQNNLESIKQMFAVLSSTLSAQKPRPPLPPSS